MWPTLKFLILALAVAEPFVFLPLIRRERSGRRLAERAAAENRARMEEIQELARIGNWEFDIVNDQIRWSEATFRIFGLPLGSQNPEFADVLLAIDAEDRTGFDWAIQRAMSENEPYSMDLRIRTPEGTLKFIHAQGSAVHDASGTAVRLIGTVLDITERKREENRLAKEAAHDALTGLANRRHFSLELEHEIRAARAETTPLAACVCDIDKFKHVNDTYGHAAGDEVIQTFARCLSEGVRRGDLPARWGGDEFSVVFPRTKASEAKISIERIRQRLESHVFTAGDGCNYNVTATFGLADLSPGMSSEALLAAADQALYSAKEQGRNRLAVAG